MHVGGWQESKRTKTRNSRRRIRKKMQEAEKRSETKNIGKIKEEEVEYEEVEDK